jgi:hypothetical protein
MDLINRYVYAVTKGLPEKQREDIEKELRTLIEDMLDQCEDQETYEAKVNKVLVDLGDPEILANNYRDSKRFLISPQNYNTYVFILKIVFGAVFIGISIAVFVGGIFSSQQNVNEIIGGYFAAIFSGLLQSFAWVTIAFAVAERKGVKILNGKINKGTWNLSQLPLIPQKKAVIPRREPIVSIIFTTILLTVFYFAPQYIAVYISREAADTQIIPVFNLDVLKGYKYLIVAIFILSIAKELIKLISGRWTARVSSLFAGFSIISTILILVIFLNNSVWNSNFSMRVMNNYGLTFDFINFWSKVKIGFIIVILSACIIEISTALYKGIKYNITK